ncbi:helix-turn-helix transcriptional regulator [Streptomyces violens]|uniref:helix-turn-helix transcriptional regulator n=1 Tax=Streptomyces violens TaxID=66377 RepID=UPI001FE0B3C2|nr:helix-turn-helix transcriptional regulator [Streptomyces violens]
MTSEVMDAATGAVRLKAMSAELAEAAVPFARDAPPADRPRVGTLLRDWRRRRRLSQLELALRADSSARHLSCVETGRARPSRAMVLRLADHLDVPLRERNSLLLAAGYAPAYRESGLEDDGLRSVRGALDMMLTSHLPYPAVVVDRGWNVVTGNRAMGVLLDGVPPELLAPPANVARMALHPEGLAARCTNLHEVRGHFMERLQREAEATGDPELRALYEEVRAYAPPEAATTPTNEGRTPEAVLPLRFRTPHGELALFSTMAVIGAPNDVTLSELAIELFFPLDDRTAEVLRTLDAAAAAAAADAEQ